MRDVYLTDAPALAAVLLDKAIAGCLADEVPEVRSLGNTSSAGAQRFSPTIERELRTGRPKGSTCA